MLFAGKSDVGRKRESNQDNFIVKKLCKNAVLLTVCDGMGGADGGNIASGIAVEVLSDMVNEQIMQHIDAESGCYTPNDMELQFVFEHAISAANSAVYNIAATTPVLKGMGTTAVCALVCDERICIANVGDSRMYLLSNGDIRQMTRDHSYVQYLLDMGEITEEEAKNSPHKNIITRALGIDDKVSADIFEITSKEGDSLLLCTDGLSNNVSPEEIRKILTDKSRDMNSKLDMLISLSNDRGGQDNITAVIAEL